MANNSTRKFTLFVFVSILIGNLLLELGDLLAIKMGLTSHYFNIWFLCAGILGLLGFSIALYRRRSNYHISAMDKMRNE